VYYKKRLVENKIKNAINKKKITPVILEDLISNGFTEISEQNYPLFFMKESYIKCTMDDDNYKLYHASYIKEALNVLLSTHLESKAKLRYKHLIDLEIEEKFSSKFKSADEIMNCPFKDFYKENFSQHFLQIIPKTNRHIQIHYMIKDRKIFFLIISHQDLIINIKVYVYVPLTFLEEINKNNFSFVMIKQDQPIQRLAFAKFVLETIVDNYTGFLFYHFVRYIDKNSFEQPVYFNQIGVVFKDIKTNPLFNVSNWNYVVQDYLKEHISNNDLPSHFSLTLDTQRFFKSSMQKFCSFIIYKNDEELFESSKDTDTLLIEFADKLKVENVSKTDKKDIMQKPFLVMNVLYNGTRSDCETSFVTHEKEFFQRIASVLFYNYYIHILFSRILEKDQKSITKYIYLFREFSVR
jgi:hypothetical protein